MSTRSRIGFQLKDGSIVSSYHHWDGYPESLGKYLVKYFQDEDDVRELIDGGDMSTCMTESGDPEYYANRGESNVEPQFSTNMNVYIQLTEDCGGEYAYVYVNGSWTCYNIHDCKYVSLYDEVAA